MNAVNGWLPLLAGALSFSSAVFAADVTTLEGVTVIGNTPIHGVGIEKNRIAAAVQSANSEDLEKSQALNVAEHLRYNFSSVTINEAVNNPFQPDVQYRGFTASPLLGLPQGLSVYVNGVRFNEPFGDTVNWDLLPEGSIDSINLFAGSNPVFGQNTLGGALSIKTKNGFDNEGSQIETSIGNDGRFNVELQTGGNDGEYGYYVIGNYYEEDGWRDHSPTEVQQALANLSWRGEESALDLTVAANNNTMIGNGAAPIGLMEAEGRESIFTQPDQTETNLSLLTLSGDTWLDDNTQLAGNVFYRRNKVKTLNGDDSDYSACLVDANNAVQSGFETGDALGGNQVSLCEFEGDEAAPLLSDYEAVEFRGGDDDDSLTDVDAALAAQVQGDDEIFDGTLNTSETKMESFGLGSQVTFLDDWNGKENQLTVGGSVDYSQIDFQSDTEFAELRNEDGEDRGVTGVGLYDNESSVRLETDVTYVGFFATDTLALNDQLDLTLSARYNYTKIDMVGIGEENLDLTGEHVFKRLNPAVGLAYQSSEHLSYYGSYSESSRAPTPAELSCADPNDPCKLPNGFVSDPPLEQVVAKSFEVGVRGNSVGYSWSAGAFHTTNHDDIIFQNAGSTASEGYFANVGETRRMGLELAANKRYENIAVGISYTWMDATFQTPYNSVSNNNPLGDTRSVEKGDSIPGLPEHNIKLVADWAATPKLDIGAEVTYQSSQFYRGDEANENEKVDGFALLNLRSTYKLNNTFELFGRIDNVFDKEYETFGVYGEADEVLEDQGIDDHRFVGPGKPRSGVIGIRAKF
ncbi:TonB-dependent receptor [Neptuniibacter sp. UBA6509]|uniref:TonB-dependent receptor n=2 Tax=unclassified Neptuniibacter TaxID=2630693 RepID=UPI0025DB6408|nr:TonB-dependent receptor [Neptuniibacter sp. UBA6509]